MFMIMKSTIFFLLGSPNDSKGYFDMGDAMRLSELVNCNAERAKENGDDRAVRDIADSKMMEYVNLERLVVIPYTNSSLLILKGKRGYWMFVADMNCWPGTLDDCDGDDGLDGTDVVVCGFRIDRKGSSESDAEYRGRVEFVEDSHGQTMTGLFRWLRNRRRMMCMWRSHWPRGFTVFSRL
ncbi:hypothetical protein DER44DRAFT_837580 [Fusarium oxysporum]|nr:hypothetical protein DER44DRAFT_837580 [Fusarium oxysporum]